MVIKQIRNTIHLGIWNEVVGSLRNIIITDNAIHLQVSRYVLSFTKDSAEANYILKMIDDGFTGKRIAILRTDISETPILIRLVACVIPSGNQNNKEKKNNA